MVQSALRESRQQHLVQAHIFKLRQGEQCLEALIENLHPALCINHAQTTHHMGNCRIKTDVDLANIAFCFERFGHNIIEALHNLEQRYDVNQKQRCEAKICALWLKHQKNRQRQARCHNLPNGHGCPARIAPCHTTSIPNHGRNGDCAQFMRFRIGKNLDGKYTKNGRKNQCARTVNELPLSTDPKRTGTPHNRIAIAQNKRQTQGANTPDKCRHM